MTPIDGVSDIRRMPRLGKIRLGIKVEGEEGKRPYPRPTDHFVVPKEVADHVGENPKKLSIMFPTNNVNDFAPQYLKCYSASQGLICKGDGFMSRRKVDTANGDFASHTTREWVWKDGNTCDPDKCPMYSSQMPQCRRVMNLLFMMPDVPGFGVWQLDTSSFYSIVNINSAIDLIKNITGRIAMIPLTLTLEPREVEPPGIKKKIVHILQLRSDFKLADIQRLGRKKPEQVLLPELDDEEKPTDLFPDEQTGGQIEMAPGDKAAAEAPAADQKPPVAKSRDPNTVKPEDVPDVNALARVCYECWGMQPTDVTKELGGGFLRDYAKTPEEAWNCFLQIKAVKEEQPPSD